MQRKECLPARRSRPTALRLIPLHRRFCDVDPKRVQLQHYSRRSPCRIRQPHSLDQPSQLRRNFRSSGWPRPTQISPVVPKSLPLLFEHRPRLNEVQRPPPLRPRPRYPGPKQAVGRPNSRPETTHLIEGELMPERCYFELKRRPRPNNPSDERREKMKPSNHAYRSAEKVQENQTARVFGNHNQCTRRVVGFAVHAGVLDGPTVCRMFGSVSRRPAHSRKGSAPTMIRYSSFIAGKPTSESSKSKRSRPCQEQ